MSIAAIGAIWLRLFLYPKSNEKSKIFPVGQASQSDIGCHLHKQWHVHKLCKHPAQMKMKVSTIFCALLAIVVGAQLISAHIECMTILSKPATKETYLEENEPVSGMLFSSEYILEEYERDGVYCIRYDDADANLFDVEIIVDSVTYQSVIDSIKSGKEMVGALVLNDSLSCHWQQVFTFVQNSENF